MGNVTSAYHYRQSEDALHGDSIYLTKLRVFGNGESLDGLHRSNPSQSKTIGFDSNGNVIDPHYQDFQEKIKATQSRLCFREQRVLVQYWSPYVVGKKQLLATIDQPFGVGVNDEGLRSYRQDSERRHYVVQKDNVQEDDSPVVRVFRKGLPEWTSDITNYLSTDFPQKECAIGCDLHGYLGLPVFNSTTGLCVGVLELLTSKKYTSYAFEVQQIRKAMKAVGLIIPKALGSPYLNVQHGRIQNIIFGILETVCGNHNLPLAQTWSISPLCCFASHNQVIMKTCNSFDTRCLEKICMSTNGLPFHVRDMKMWSFRKACRERHVDKSRGYIGRALSSKGLSFCGDVTKLGDEEYPLVYNARMSRLTSCFAVFLHNGETNIDCVLEFFLLDSKCLPDVVQTLKQKFEAAGGFELGDTSSIQVVGPPTEVNSIQTENMIIQQIVGPRMKPPLKIEPDTESTTTSCVYDNFMYQLDSSDTDSISSMAKTCDIVTDTTGELVQGKKRKIDSETVTGMVEDKVIKPKINPETVQSDTRMVIVEVTFNESTMKFEFAISMSLSDLKTEVASRLNLQGNNFKLKYTDEDNDLIFITCDVDLKLALDKCVRNNIFTLICLPD